MTTKLNRMSVPFLDLKAQYETIRSKLTESLQSVLESQHFILGPVVEKLEKACAEYCESKYALGVSSGTDALLMALMAMDIRPGDEVITTNFSFVATASVIHRVGARPVFVDIDPETYNMQPAEIQRAVSLRTRAIIPVHLYGQCVEMEPILDIARKHRLVVIEDAAQAFGATWGGKAAGTLGDIGCFSFYPTKNLGGIGDGGLITVQSSELHQKFMALRNQGSVTKGPYHFVGGNFRLDAVQAAALLVKLPYLRDWNKARAANAETYARLFKEAGLVGKVTIPKCLPLCQHIYHQYVIRVQQRDELQGFLGQQGVATAVYYPRPLNEEPCFSYLGYSQEKFPESNRVARECLALPIYPELTSDQIRYVVEMVGEFYHLESRRSRGERD